MAGSFLFRGHMAGDKSLKYMLLTLALALTCTLVGSVRLFGADGSGGRKDRDSVLALVPDTSRLLLVSGHTHFVSRDYRKAHRDEFIPLRRKPSPHLWQTSDLISGPLPAHVNVIYRDAHMRIRQRVQMSYVQE